MSRYSVDVVIPVHNEGKTLKSSIIKLTKYLEANVSFDWRIIVADNASKDNTPEVSKELESRFKKVFYMRLPQKGRGRALRHSWLISNADVMCYMDADLSTDLKYLNDLVEPLAKNKYDVAIGSRLKRGAKVINRSLRREIISRAYNIFIRIIFPGYKIKDAQCGFKAITNEAIHKIAPLIKDNKWFFDTELLLKALKLGYRINELPVIWVDDRTSTVNVVDTAWKDIKGLFRVRFGG